MTDIDGPLLMLRNTLSWGAVHTNEYPQIRNGSLFGARSDHEFLENGEHEVNFDVTGLSSGLYDHPLVLGDGEKLSPSRMILLK